MRTKTKIRSEIANNPLHERDMKIRTGVRCGRSEAEVMNNPLYVGAGSEGDNPLFAG
jgi:hypothetical protein